MFEGASAPPAQSGTTWSTTKPGQAPVVLPVAGHGLARLNSRTAAALRGAAVWASRIATAKTATCAGRRPTKSPEPAGQLKAALSRPAHRFRLIPRRGWTAGTSGGSLRLRRPPMATVALLVCPPGQIQPSREALLRRRPTEGPASKSSCAPCHHHAAEHVQPVSARMNQLIVVGLVVGQHQDAAVLLPLHSLYVQLIIQR